MQYQKKKTGMNSGAPEGWAVPGPLEAPSYYSKLAFDIILMFQRCGADTYYRCEHMLSILDFNEVLHS